MTMRIRFAAVAALAAGWPVQNAAAQWTVTTLHPAVATRSRAQAVSNGRQAGYSFFSNRERAVLWAGTPGSVTDLHPAAASYSRVYGFAGGDGAGVARLGLDHAAAWLAPSMAFVDLHPAGAFSSIAYGTDGTRQVGIAYLGTPPGGQYHASLWTDTPGSWVSLHPGTIASFAYGVHAGQQVGYTDMGGFVQNAALWSGDAGSWVNLHPAAATNSVAWGVHSGRQVGVATIGGADRASLWTGTADSWIDLHPAGAAASEASGAFEGYQVGSATIGGVQHASIWSGSAASWFDLSTVLTGSWGDTEAESIWVDSGAGVIYVAGWGRNLTASRDEALLWSAPLPSGCDPDFNCDGNPDQDDVGCIINAVAGNPGCECQDPDFNGDGNVDQEDVAAVINVVAGGSCP